MKSLLKAVRKEKGLKQSEVAVKAQISLRAYQNYEGNKRTPNAHIAQILAKTLESSVEELFPV
jgi:transcriptional regulator with XRE-family HTH domain